ARLWRVGDGSLVRVVTGAFARVSDAEFSPDGRWLVTAGPTTAGLFDLVIGRGGFLRGHGPHVVAAAFAPDGRTITTAPTDGTVRRFECDLCGGIHEQLALAQRRLAATGRQLSPAERETDPRG